MMVTTYVAHLITVALHHPLVLGVDLFTKVSADRLVVCIVNSMTVEGT